MFRVCIVNGNTLDLWGVVMRVSVKVNGHELWVFDVMNELVRLNYQGVSFLQIPDGATVQISADDGKRMIQEIFEFKKPDYCDCLECRSGCMG